MKKWFLFPGISLLLLQIATSSLSQDYDLIVTIKGDSIVCRIDSITETHIHYEMKSKHIWIHTLIQVSMVSKYEQDVINRRDYLYKPGTTIIDSSIPAVPASMFHVRKNSVYIGILSLNYARMIPLGQKTGLTLGGGLINIDGWGVVAESTVLYGGVKHFLESGIMGAYFFEPSSESDEILKAVTLRVGYRYQAPRGLLFRVAPNFIFSTEDNIVFAALSIGYSF
jgi:hypothetical protein